MRLPLNLVCLALSILPRTYAVFADEAFSVDYQHELLGLPQQDTTFFHRPRKDEKATLLYTLSDLGVVGAVNPGTGKVVWRQLLGNGSAETDGFLRPVEGDGTVVSALGSRVDAWDGMTGRSKWGNIFAGQIKDLEIVEGGDAIKDVLILSEDSGTGIVRRLNGDNGDVVWEYTDASGDMPLQGLRGGYSVKVSTVDPLTGKKVSEYILGTKGDVHSPQDVLLVGANSAAPIIAWTDKYFKNLKVNILGKPSDLHTLPLMTSDGELTKVTLHAPHLVQSLPHFLVHSHSAISNRADVYHIDIAKGTIDKAYELPKLGGKGAISISSQEANVYFTRFTEDETITVSSVSHGVIGRWPIKTGKHHGHVLHGASEVVQRTPDTYAVRSAILNEEQDWVLVRNGAESWTRVEGLSGAVAAEWAEIPVSESLAKTLEAEAHSNPLSAYIHRLKRHINDLQYLPGYLQKLPSRFLSAILPGDLAAPKSGALERDSFGFNKLVIVATQRGRLYGLDAGSQGSVVWTLKAFDIPEGKNWDPKAIYVDSVKGTTTIRGSEGEYVVVQTADGKRIEATDPGTHVQSVALVDSEAGRWMLPIGLDGTPGDVPKDWAPKDFLVVRGSNGEIKGLKFDVSGSDAKPVFTWTFQPARGQKIVNVVSKPAHDPVASIGRVLGDRTVLYKYLNPNVALITAVSDESSMATFYLLDTISGDILYSATHQGVDTKKPIASVFTENWFAYSLWSDELSTPTSQPGAKGYQLVVSDLYESPIPNDRGTLGSSANFSNLEPYDIPNAGPIIPHVTRQGITTRQLLCTLTSNAIVGIPRYLLDPRRPVGRDPTAAEQEEGLLRYQPVIEFDPKMIITHKREVLGIRNVITSPALLESTSLVFAYGIDIFGTRVTPSAAFDILGKSFNKLSLVTTVLALGAGVTIVAPMVRRKQINGRWLA
ncbi:ER membrane complex subunit 1 protein [Rutstroemia sp. NJR-2017a BBW]|nr:ER membrane complex subunit 1 protein [Rutstroemia sp. NJR-2017a BBW]